MGTTIQLRRDTAANWTAVNPVLAQGEAGIEFGSPMKMKIGDGTTAWSALPYQSSPSSGGTGTGDNGLSAYQVAVAAGFVGTEATWLLSLKGATGASAYQLAVAAGFVGTEASWLLSLKGAAGASAYQLAVAAGFSGSEAAWLLTLKGAAGLSAYQIAVAAGFVGTEAAWLEGLKAVALLQSSDGSVAIAQVGNLHDLSVKKAPTVTLPWAQTINWNAATATIYKVTLSGDGSLANPTANTLIDGATYMFVIKQDNTGVRALTFGSVFRFPNREAPTLSTDANAIDIITGFSDGTNLFVTMVQNFSSL